MILLLSVLLQSLLPATSALELHDLKSGDVLLESLPCYLCTLIETEEGEPYSHAGIVIKEGTEYTVLQAWNRVEQVPIEQFLRMRRIGTPVEVLRPLRRKTSPALPSTEALMTRFKLRFEGLSYDGDFLWDNQDTKGEKLYCSEFVAKFLIPELGAPLETKPMHYVRFRAEWIRYFNGFPPDGKPGISPADLHRSPSFQRLGFL